MKGYLAFTNNKNPRAFDHRFDDFEDISQFHIGSVNDGCSTEIKNHQFVFNDDIKTDKFCRKVLCFSTTYKHLAYKAYNNFSRIDRHLHGHYCSSVPREWVEFKANGSR